MLYCDVCEPVIVAINMWVCACTAGLRHMHGFLKLFYEKCVGVCTYPFKTLKTT